MASEYQSLYRPTTFFNQVLHAVFSRSDVRHDLSSQILDGWKADSHNIFGGMVDDKEALDKVVEDAVWQLFDDKSPSINIWFGEATFSGRQTPQVNIYRDSVTTRLPTSQLFHLAGQSGVDHLFGHLYAFYAGINFSEEAACKYQYLAAQQRGGVVWNGVAASVVLLHKLHKKIPFANYH